MAREYIWEELWKITCRYFSMHPSVLYFHHLSVFLTKSLKVPPLSSLIRTKWETFAELNLEHIVREQILFHVLAPFDGV
jgi:hypothetical protein